VSQGGIKKIPIKKIIVSPDAKADITIESTKAFLENMGYEDVDVISSSVAAMRKCRILGNANMSYFCLRARPKCRILFIKGKAKIAFFTS
jgi:hypothetical protein